MDDTLYNFTRFNLRMFKSLEFLDLCSKTDKLQAIDGIEYAWIDYINRETIIRHEND